MFQKLFFMAMLFCMANSQEFTNPILDRNSADPFVLKMGSYYYLTLSENREMEIVMYKSPVLTNFRDAESKVIMRAPPGYLDLWASEIHNVDGELWMYFTMRTENREHRMYAVKAENPNDPMGNWGNPIRMLPDWDNVAIDGTILKMDNNRNYFVWSSGVTGHGSIYISPMENPFTTSPHVVMIREPTQDWECQDICTSEGPFFIYNERKAFMIFSASMTWNPNYCLTQSSIELSRDPMDPSAWEHAPGPVFQRNDAESVYTTGHASFTVSPDERETWMVYHATESQTDINGFRTARLEKIDWNQDGPIFPQAHGYSHPQPVPSGQN
ncbi:Extracellular exo-alpha-(1-_5)-L-arabinofuranosidase [Orchesella cincta]|uniref:Extracellular exo-alpha-(1->5)-L-arabinofuranosidase n=1 Tax=Orchesella cincta TaxID=48709 RepID=A0A1D2MBB0_ORCCI|nr:Extracellular exo-alpha-(1->5)-L-arabinofuranosidase [Orchesella cincta]